MSYEQLKNQTYLEDVLNQISSVSQAKLPTGPLKPSDINSYIREVRRFRSISARVKRKKFVAFDDAGSSENKSNNGQQMDNMHQSNGDVVSDVVATENATDGEIPTDECDLADAFQGFRLD